jgi:hypothetical protein
MFNDEQSVKFIKEKINEILSRREFQKPNEKNPVSDMINRLWESIKEWIESILFKTGKPKKEFSIETDFIPAWAQNVLKISLIVIAVVIVFILIRAVIRRLYFKARTKRLKPSDPKACYRYVLCRTSKRNTRSRTRENCVRKLPYKLLYNNVNKELHLQELYSSARASRNSQKCF